MDFFFPCICAFYYFSFFYFQGSVSSSQPNTSGGVLTQQVQSQPGVQTQPQMHNQHVTSGQPGLQTAQQQQQVAQQAAAQRSRLTLITKPPGLDPAIILQERENRLWAFDLSYKLLSHM